MVKLAALPGRRPPCTPVPLGRARAPRPRRPRGHRPEAQCDPLSPCPSGRALRAVSGKGRCPFISPPCCFWVISGREERDAGCTRGTWDSRPGATVDFPSPLPFLLPSSATASLSRLQGRRHLPSLYVKELRASACGSSFGAAAASWLIPSLGTLLRQGDWEQPILRPQTTLAFSQRVWDPDPRGDADAAVSAAPGAALRSELLRSESQAWSALQQGWLGRSLAPPLGAWPGRPDGQHVRGVARPSATRDRAEH